MIACLCHCRSVDSASMADVQAAASPVDEASAPGRRDGVGPSTPARSSQGQEGPEVTRAPH